MVSTDKLPVEYPIKHAIKVYGIRLAFFLAIIIINIALLKYLPILELPILSIIFMFTFTVVFILVISIHYSTNTLLTKSEYHQEASLQNTEIITNYTDEIVTIKDKQEIPLENKEETRLGERYQEERIRDESEKRKASTITDETPPYIFVAPPSRLSYSGLLLVRSYETKMYEEVRNLISNEIQAICDSYLWTLNRIDITGEFLLFNVSVPNITSPGYLMRMFRVRTSNIIKTKYPEVFGNYKDFWAPGYLIIGGSQLPEQNLIEKFILITRQRQGYIK